LVPHVDDYLEQADNNVPGAQADRRRTTGGGIAGSGAAPSSHQRSASVQLTMASCCRSPGGGNAPGSASAPSSVPLRSQDPNDREWIVVKKFNT